MKHGGRSVQLLGCQVPVRLSCCLDYSALANSPLTPAACATHAPRQTGSLGSHEYAYSICQSHGLSSLILKTFISKIFHYSYRFL